MMIIFIRKTDGCWGNPLIYVYIYIYLGILINHYKDPHYNKQYFIVRPRLTWVAIPWGLSQVTTIPLPASHLGGSGHSDAGAKWGDSEGIPGQPWRFRNLKENNHRWDVFFLETRPRKYMGYGIKYQAQLVQDGDFWDINMYDNYGRKSFAKWP